MTTHETAGHTTTTGLDNRKVMMWAFIGSDCLFFASLVSTYLLYRGKSVVGPYPYEVFNIPYTSVSAFVLLMSSLTMVLALSAIQRGDHTRLRIWLLATSILGCIFLGGQYFEFTVFVEQGVTLQGNLFGSSFFTLTSFHGLHVTFGVVILMSFFIMSLRGRLSQEQSLNIELAGLYWHFVDIVWIVIFTVVYLIEAPNIVH
ncbi:MAG: heme-copper oxidase subunit III [Dehalococcoidia bacterium]|jgi:heme/copper-type cytochrome/quinol oxidase subunit 3|tara:strand:- start:471 stop:1076 length:606 start_codon:yes stop_codon:yes gene_type:complete